MFRILAFWLCMSMSLVAFAAETGTLRGTVRDGTNQNPLEGVQVTVEGSSLPTGRNRATDARGSFWFPLLPPGQYRVTFTREGYQTRAFDATIRLDLTTTLPPVDLNLVSFSSETIEVVESAPVIDNTQSAVAESVGTDYIERLPVGRSYQAVIRTLPGISGRIDYSDGGPSDGNPSVRGEGREGNNYFLEGFSIRDPVEKTTGPDFPFDALQELVVYTDGAPAEFGSFTGMAANMVLKSGTNDAHGSVAYILDRNASWGTYEIMGEQQEKRQFLFQSPVATLGGPIVKDKLWFYSVYNHRMGRNQYEGSDVVATVPYDYMFVSKFTYNPFTDSRVLFTFTVQKQGSKAENAGGEANVAPEATVNGLFDMLSLNGNMKAVLSPEVVFEAKWNKLALNSYSEPVGGSYYDASYTDYYTGYVSGNTSYTYNTYRLRQGFAIHLTRYVTELVGQHVVKGGFESHRLANADEFIYTGGFGTEENPAYEYVYLDDNGDGTFQPGEEYMRTAHYNVGPIGNKGSSVVGFLQDQWQPFAGMVLNLGLRYDTEALLNNEGRKVISQGYFSPRFGLTWDVSRDSANVVTFNVGRYYDVNGLSFAEWANNRSSNYYTQCEWDAEARDYVGSCYTQDPVAFPLVYDEELQPYHMDKATLGFTRALGNKFAVGLKGIVSRTLSLPEDTQFQPGDWRIVNPELKRRDYWALELTGEKHFSDNWQVLSSLTYSHAKGTNPGSFETGSGESTGGAGNEVGVFMDDIADPYLRVANDYFGYDFYGLGYNSFEGFGQVYPGADEGWYGYLPYHSFFNFKFNASYQFDFGTELGLVYEYDSGHAWQRRGIQELYGNHLIFPEGRGSRFMPPVQYVDFRLAQTFTVAKDLKVKADLTVFNLLDFETPISYDENYNQSEDPYGGYYDDAGAPTESEFNTFGKVRWRQAPRAVRANLTFQF